MSDGIRRQELNNYCALEAALEMGKELQKKSVRAVNTNIEAYVLASDKMAVFDAKVQVKGNLNLGMYILAGE